MEAANGEIERIANSLERIADDLDIIADCSMCSASRNMTTDMEALCEANRFNNEHYRR